MKRRVIAQYCLIFRNRKKGLREGAKEKLAGAGGGGGEGGGEN